MANLNVLKAVWGKKEGYVFLPVRRETWGEGRAYKYPDEWDAIETRVKAAAEGGYDVYWCPLVFKEPKRIKENAQSECQILWADLDFVDPTKLDYKPSVAWKSSDDRYQALWFLTDKHDISDVEKLNRKMTYSIGADKGGWDVTQVLRVPGTPNNKYSPPQQGKLLWAEKVYYEFDSLDSALKDDSHMDISEDDSIEALIDGWGIPDRTRELLTVDPEEVVVGERSDRLWEIETSLIESGLPVMQVVKIVAACPWNKFKGRRDEYNQIYQEVLKAEHHVKVREHRKEPIITLVESEKDKIKEDLWAVPFATFMAQPIEKPQWLIEGIWQKTTYGMMAGEPKTYKSVNAMDMALSIASGVPYLGKFPVHTTGAVIYIQEENGKGTIQDRAFKIAYQKGLLTNTGFGLSMPEDLPLYFCNNYGIDLTSKESRQLVEETIKQIRPVMVILDPLYMMLGGADENSASEVRDILRWLTYLRNTYSTAIMVCHHYNKSGSGSDVKTRGGSRVRGTSQFHGWVESALYVKKPIEVGRIMIEREFRSFPSTSDISIKIEMGEPGELKYIPIIDEAEELIVEELKKDEICTSLASGTKTFGELKTDTALPKLILSKALKELELDGTVEVIEKGKTKHYTLKEKVGIEVVDLDI